MKKTSKSNAKISLGMAVKDKSGITKLLSLLLANEHVLYIKMRNFHWNLVGPSFVEVHEFIEKLYNITAADIDVVAERIQQLGFPAPGSMKEFLALATMVESKGAKKEQTTAIFELAQDNDTMAISLRKMIKEIEEDYNDPGTVDILVKIIQSHEKNAWMLRRYLG